MMAGSLALLEEPADDTLTSHYGSGAALEVDDTQQYLDENAVQTGTAASRVETKTEDVVITSSSIEVDQAPSLETIHTEWTADVQTGFVLAERTKGSEPEFPWGVFRSATDTIVSPAEINTSAYARDNADNIDTWFAGRDVAGRDDVKMDYHAAATLGPTKDAPSIGIGIEQNWGGHIIRGVLYSSGYLAIYNESVGPIQFARFVHEEVLPYATVPDDDEQVEQQTLEQETRKEEGSV